MSFSNQKQGAATTTRGADPPTLTMASKPSGMGGNQTSSTWWLVAVHSTRTAVAAMASLEAARLLRLPEAYWAPITTLVITQSSLGAALSVSGERFMGTLLGAAFGGIVGSCFPSNLIVFGVSILLVGLLTAAAHLNRSAYRFAGVTLGIVLLIQRLGSPWQIALYRFAEVCIGIGVALVLTIVWPEHEELS